MLCSLKNIFIQDTSKFNLCIPNVNIKFLDY